MIVPSEQECTYEYIHLPSLIHLIHFLPPNVSSFYLAMEGDCPIPFSNGQDFNTEVKMMPTITPSGHGLVVMTRASQARYPGSNPGDRTLLSQLRFSP